MPLTILNDFPNNYDAPGGQQDTILGLGGNDTLNGADQSDSILGGTGDDQLDGGSQTDTVRGEDGNDSIINPSGGNDLLDGGDGNDVIAGGSEAETLLGGLGNDTLSGGGGDDLIDGGDGDDLLTGGGYGTETLLGGAGNDHLVANGGARVMSGGAGDDTFSGFTNDSAYKFIHGGGGTDRAIIPGIYNAANLTIADGTVPGTSLAYQASYVTETGFRLYFAEFNGMLDFDNVDVPLDVVCFAEGTRIMTPDGERAIETLRAGDLVVTCGGQGAAFKPVRWVGRREVNLDTHPRAADVAPILLLPGALGDGLPHRPLRVSPDHAMLVEGALVPARLLLDGEAIRRLPAKGRVTYFHLELDAHDILLAEGAPTESYIDLGNRAAFDNGGVVRMLHADFSPRRAGGMPRVTEGPALDRARLALARRRAERRAAG